MSDEKIVLPPSQTEFLRKTLAAAFEEAPARVQRLIEDGQPAKLEEKKAASKEEFGIIF